MFSSVCFSYTLTDTETIQYIRLLQKLFSGQDREILCVYLSNHQND